MTVTAAQLLEPPVAGVDQAFQRTYTAKMQVFSDKTDGPLTVLNAPGIPRWGSYYRYFREFDIWSVSQTYKPNPIARVKYDPGDGKGEREMIKWEVVIGYGTRPTGRSSQDRVEDPLLEPPVISGSFVGGSVPATRDKDGVPLRNTAGEALFPRPTILDNTDTLNISFNAPDISLPQRAEMMGCVNSTELWGLQPRQVLLSRWSWQIQYSGSFAYIKNDLEFLISYKEVPAVGVICIGTDYAGKKGWYHIEPNEGMAPLTIADDQTKKKKARDEQDVPLTNPVKLQCNGLIELGATEKFNVFALEKEKDFHEIYKLPDPLRGPFRV